MTTSKDEERKDRIETMMQDADLRRRQQQSKGSTYLDHTHSDIGGRFAVTEHETVTGRPSPAPPPLPPSSPWSGSDPVPDEPPLGYRIDEMQPPTVIPSVGFGDPAPDDPSRAASPTVSDRNPGSSSSQEQDDDAA